ncbi:MAG: DUF3782 domain-containing protein [bacterium]
MTGIEVERGFQEIWDLFRETDNKIKETDKMFKETDERFKETDERFKETDRELSIRFKEMEKAVERSTRSVDALTGKWGRFVEGLIAPAAERLFRERGIEVDGIAQRVRRRKGGEEMEIDILGVNGEYVTLVEAKSTLRLEYVNDHLKRLERFKTFFPEYSDRKVIGAIGGIAIEEEADRYAAKRGLFVIVESGDSVRFLNDGEFKPRIW